MTEQSTRSILIAAGAADVMAVIADFANYPAWASSIKKAEVLKHGSDGRAAEVAFSLDAGVVHDQYRLIYTWTGNDKVEWALITGQLMTAQVGSYTLAVQGAQTCVTYSLSVDLSIPMLGLLKRKGERVVMDTALNALKKRVESGA